MEYLFAYTPNFYKIIKNCEIFLKPAISPYNTHFLHLPDSDAKLDVVMDNFSCVVNLFKIDTFFTLHGSKVSLDDLNLLKEPKESSSTAMRVKGSNSFRLEVRGSYPSNGSDFTFTYTNTNTPKLHH
jgi:hypothetical protein